MQCGKLYYEEKTESLAHKAGCLIVQYATILRDYVAEPFSRWVCTPRPDISNAAPTKPCHFPLLLLKAACRGINFLELAAIAAAPAP